MTDEDLGFVHTFEAPADATAPVLLLLHGTGGDEHDLLPLGRALAPGSGLLGPRGKVLERGMPRFFRRLAEGVFDVADLRRRTVELARFVVAATARHGLEGRAVVAVGFSNGANIGGSLLLLEPDLLAAAILFRPMVPFVPDPLSAIPGTPVFLSGGRADPIVPPDETERLAALLRHAGAEVTLSWEAAGHELTPGGVARARAWLSALEL